MTLAFRPLQPFRVFDGVLLTRDFTEFDFAYLPLDSRITFTRASAGTYFDADGVMRTAAINQPRIDHDPVTGAVRGLLVEEQRTNLSLWSEDFGNAAWGKGRSTITANALIAPDGTLSGYLLSDTTDNGSHTLQGNRSKASSAVTYTFSYYAKAGSFPRSRILMAGISFNDRATATIDLENGQVDIPAETAGNFSNASVKVRDVGDGWYRIALTATSDTTSVIRYDLRIDNGTTDSYVGSGGGNIGVWGAQLEAGSFPTSYIPTEGTAMTRAADVSVTTGITAPLRINDAEGTIFAEVSFSSPAETIENKNVIQIDSGSTGNRHLINRQNRTGFILGTTFLDNTLVGPVAVLSAVLNDTVIKVAYGYKLDDMACYVTGRAPATDNSGQMPVGLSRLVIGSIGNAQFLNGHIRRIRYYPRRLSNAELQALTS